MNVWIEIGSTLVGTLAGSLYGGHKLISEIYATSGEKPPYNEWFQRWLAGDDSPWPENGGHEPEPQIIPFSYPPGFVPTAFWFHEDFDETKPLVVPYHPTSTLRMTQDETMDYRHGVCPGEVCGSPCRIVEIDGRRFYTCSDKSCPKSTEAWSAYDKGYVLAHKPLRWVPRDICVYSPVNGWYVDPDPGEPPPPMPPRIYGDD